jgi:nucleotide-binding universal stress UspA family protein
MNFIVAVDGSEQSEKALEHAVSIAAAAGADVTVVHAVDPAVYSEGGDEPVSDIPDAEDRLILESEEDAEERGLQVLDDMVTLAAGLGADVETVLLHGDPSVAIPEFLETADADGVFVGHRGLSERYERILGSVAKSLLESSPVPVTIVEGSDVE